MQNFTNSYITDVSIYFNVDSFVFITNFYMIIVLCTNSAYTRIVRFKHKKLTFLIKISKGKILSTLLCFCLAEVCK